jgi:argininosuccinate lyase
VAQPVSFAHHLLAYVEMLARDGERMGEVRSRTNHLPLGIISDRDFAIEFASAASLAMVHLSRFSEELVLWSSQSFGFIELADRFCTGSSIMPQKKNPDVPELARGKTGRIVGHLMGLLMLMKGQPLAYNKDNQEDKEPLFDTVDTLKDTLRVFAEMIPGITVKAEAMERATKLGYATATALADALVYKGVPFRDAHEAVAKVVRHAAEQGVGLEALSLATLQSFHPAIGAEVQSVLTPKGSLASRNVLGGTAPEQVRAQLARHRARLGQPTKPAMSPSLAS